MFRYITEWMLNHIQIIYILYRICLHRPFDKICIDTRLINYFDKLWDGYYTIFKLFSLFDLIISLFRRIRPTLLLNQLFVYVYSLSTN